MKIKKQKIIKSIITIITILILSQTITYAHSGRTDSNGGHKDNKNVSGLGSYHYHCGGNPPHLHANGVCPYSSSASSSNSSSKSTSNKKSSSSKSSSSSTTSTKTSSNTSSKATQKTTSTESNTPKTIEVTSIQIQNKDKTDLTTGDTHKLTATIEPSNATNNKITWNSNNTSIATVNENGEVKALKEGTVKITSKSTNGKEDSIELNIKNPEIKISNIILNETNISMNIGDTKQITITIEPNNATNKTITWTSLNENIATVENGKVTAITEGTTDITATSENGITSTCKVNVINPNKIEATINSNNSSPQPNNNMSPAIAIGSLAAIGGGTGIALTTNKKKKRKH